MKKLVCAILSLLLVLALVSCNLEDGAGFETPRGNDSSDSSGTPPSNGGDDGQSESGGNRGPSGNTDQSQDGGDDNNDNNDDNDDNGSTPSASLDAVNNGVLKDASARGMIVPENMKFLGTEYVGEENNAQTISATAVLYVLDGNVVNWTTENDFIYVITSGNNRLVVIDSQSMLPVYNVPLASVPAEMNVIGDRIYISLPDLCKIDVFSKSNGTKEASIFFDREISSFCFDGDYIFYSEHDQWCKVFRKNLITNDETQIEGLFYFPKLYLNQEDRILYVGESGSSGSGLYYYDADTLTLKSSFKKNNYGITNHTREIFHVGDDIFWGGYRLSDTNARDLIGKYGTKSYGSVVFASEELVSTYEGLFLTETYECIINYFDAGFNFEYILVSDSYNVFFRQRSMDRNIIVGVNFELQ